MKKLVDTYVIAYACITEWAAALIEEFPVTTGAITGVLVWELAIKNHL